MSKESTLQRVASDIERGYLGTARDRLHGLIHAYPNDLSLRSHLADVYWQLRHPGMAGLYWFLEPKRTDDIKTAIAEFERECGGDPWVILSRLKIKWEPDALPEGFAKEQIQELIEQCQKKYKRTPNFPKPKAQDLRERKATQFRDCVWQVGCFSALLVLAFLVLMGVIHVGSWFSK